MPWRCPACSIPIQHNELEPEPRPQIRYRCHVCRLELVFDELARKLVVPPFTQEIAGDKPPRKRKR